MTSDLLNGDYYWPESERGDTVYQTCNGMDVEGNASRTCNSQGMWLPVDFTECTDEGYSELEDLLESVSLRKSFCILSESVWKYSLPVASVWYTE